MDGVNRHADPEVPADEIQLRLVAFQSGRSAAPTAVHLQRLVGMAQHSPGRTPSRKTTLRTITHAADVVSNSWTATKRTKRQMSPNSVLTRQLLGQQEYRAHRNPSRPSPRPNPPLTVGENAYVL